MVLWCLFLLAWRQQKHNTQKVLRIGKTTKAEKTKTHKAEWIATCKRWNKQQQQSPEKKATIINWWDKNQSRKTIIWLQEINKLKKAKKATINWQQLNSKHINDSITNVSVKRICKMHPHFSASRKTKQQMKGKNKNQPSTQDTAQKCFGLLKKEMKNYCWREYDYRQQHL